MEGKIDDCCRFEANNYSIYFLINVFAGKYHKSKLSKNIVIVKYLDILRGITYLGNKMEVAEVNFNVKDEQIINAEIELKHYYNRFTNYSSTNRFAEVFHNSVMDSYTTTNLLFDFSDCPVPVSEIGGVLC